MHAPTSPLTIAIVGATGAVGAELLHVLEMRKFPVGTLKLLASPRSAGSKLLFRGEAIEVEALSAEAFDGVDIAFFSAGASRSREFAPIAQAKGALVIDNSSAFRMEDAVPLVIPEVNAHAIGSARLIANPNCVAAICAVALAPLLALAPIERLILSTYQSASGAGARAMEELVHQTRAVLAGEPAEPEVLPHPYAFNLFSHNAAIEDNGYNGEENKVIAELRKILGQPALRISATCVRVPVLRAHSASINIEFNRPISEQAARECLSQARGIALVDDRARNHFPMPLDASGRDEVLVGRIRQDLSHPHGLELFVAGDQLLKGAALNAIQIAEAALAH